MSEEIWKSIIIDDKTTNYEVSSIGNVRNKTTGKILTLSKKDYIYCDIYVDKTKKNLVVHRLVADAFFGKSLDLDKNCIDHINGNHHDNRVDNLEWVSHSENVKRAHQNENRTSTGKKVEQWNYETKEYVATFESLREMSKALDVSEKNFHANLSGRTKYVNTPSGKYFFKYADEKILMKSEELDEFEKIKNVENFLIHKDGRIYNVKRKIFMKPRLNKGYMYIVLNEKNCPIHRLVAIQFIPNLENKEFVNHKDGNKLNNNVDNLEWVTRSENNQHAYDTDLNTNYKSIHMYELSGKYIKTFKTISDACRELNLDCKLAGSTISRCCQGKNKYAYNYIWKFASEHDTKDISSVEIYNNKPISIDKFDLNDNFVATFNNLGDAAQSIGKTNKNTKLISLCCKNQLDSAYGYKWKFH
jgi:hypothetical protein